MRVALGPGVSLLRPDADVSDLTASVRQGAHWDEGDLIVDFDVEPSPAEQRLIRRRLLTRDAAHEAWVGRVVDADAMVRTSLTLNTATKTLLRLLAQGALLGIEDLDMEA